MGDVPRGSGLGRLPGRQLCGWHTRGHGRERLSGHRAGEQGLRGRMGLDGHRIGGRLGRCHACPHCARRGGSRLSHPRVMRAQQQRPRLGSWQGAGDGSPRCTRHSQHPSPERLGWALTSVPCFPSGPSGWWRGALLPPATVSSVGDAGAEAAEATKWGGPGAPPGLYQGRWASSSCPTVAWAGARPLRTVACDQ